MTDELFFLPILASAARRPDDVASWREAFAQIRERCDNPREPGARENWYRFLDAVFAVTDSDEEEAIADAAFRMLLDRLEEHESESPADPADLWRTDSHREGYARFITCVKSSLSRAASLVVQFLHGRDLLAAWPWPLTGEAMVRNLRPGDYTIALDTGWRLWAGRLEAEDLLWHRAFPQRPLAVAAESGPPTVHPSRHIRLGVAPLTMVVYPGVETGAVRLVAELPPACFPQRKERRTP